MYNSWTIKPWSSRSGQTPHYLNKRRNIFSVIRLRLVTDLQSLKEESMTWVIRENSNGNHWMQDDGIEVKWMNPTAG